MDSTPFSKKCEILHDFYMEYSESDEYEDFFALNDLGFPAAILAMNGGAVLLDEGERFVEETWVALCEKLYVDHYGEYASLDHLLLDE